VREIEYHGAFGLTVDIDPRYPGFECWVAGAGIAGRFDNKGNKITDNTRPGPTTTIPSLPVRGAPSARLYGGSRPDFFSQATRVVSLPIWANNSWSGNVRHHVRYIGHR
jgi:hypothetical protein